MKNLLKQRLTRLLFLPLLLLGITGIALPVIAAKKPVQNLLIIIVDTLRADHVGCYGYQQVQTPAIDGLAKEGVLFTTTICQVPITLPSHCSIFTGTYPTYHKVQYNGLFYLDDSAVTLAELLKEHGYRTAAVVGAYVLDARFGLKQGFDDYDDETELGRKGILPQDAQFFGSAERRAAAVTDRAIQWLAKHRGDQFFLWLHYYDPHDPYDPPAPYSEQYPQRPYDGEIAYTDYHISRVLTELKKLGLLTETLILFTADHGECLGEHKEQTHGIFLYDAALKVPLIIRAPGVLPKGKRIEAQVRTIDIMPTVLSLLEIPIPKEVQGISLLPLIKGKKGKPLVSYSESYQPRIMYNWSETKCLRSDRWKYIQAPTPELYDLSSDPGELKNLVEKETKLAARFKAELSQLENETSQPGAALASRRKPDKETIEKLRSLGYLGPVSSLSESRQEEKTALPDPKDRIDVLGLIAKADKILEEQPDAALNIINQGLKIDPGNFKLRYQLAYCHIAKNEYERAAQVFTGLATDCPSEPRPHFELASIYVRLSKYDEAIKEALTVIALDERNVEAHLFLGSIYGFRKEFAKAKAEFEKVVELDPENTEARTRLGQTLERQGKFDQALKQYEAILSYEPRNLSNLNNLGNLHDELRQHQTAEEYYLRALEIDPQHILSLLNLGVCYARQGKKAAAIKQFEKVLQLDPNNPHAQQFLKAVQE